MGQEQTNKTANGAPSRPPELPVAAAGAVTPGAAAKPLPLPLVAPNAAAAAPMLPAVPSQKTPNEAPAGGVQDGPARATPADEGRAPGRRAAKRREAGPARAKIAANDDIPTIGALIYALEQKPSKQPFKVAAYGSVLWAAVGLGYTWVLLASELGRAPLAEILTRPAALALVASLFMPIALFWFLALLVWRAQELKLMSSAMTEVAVRLAEPDRGAEQSVSSLGQTVRKQVHFMNEAVTQAIGRAGELEAMVHSEVSNLERSFQENETRIRRVLSELASERTQLVATSGDVHATLRAMGDEVPALIEKLNGQQGKLARIIESAGQNLIALEGALYKASDKLEGSLLSVSDKIEGNLLSATDKVDALLTGASERIEGALSSRTGHLQQVLDEYTGAINLALGNRTSQMQAVFEDYTKALDATLVERTRALDGAFAERVRLFDDSIGRSTMQIDSVVGEKAVALSAAMERHARDLAATLGRQSTDIDETLMHGIDAVRRSSENITKQSVKAIEGLSGQADMLRNVSENLLTQIGSVTNRFETQGQSIMRAANALETANFRIDNTLQQRHRELGDTLEKLTGKAGEIDALVQGYSSNLEGSMSAAESRARALTSELSRNTETYARSTLSDLERVRAETEAQATRTLSEMQNQFSSVGREMSSQMGSLSARLSETSEDLRLKTQRAAAEIMAEQERLRSEAERIPAATRETTDAMRRALNEQIRALDQLSALSKTEQMRRDVTPPVPLSSTAAPRASLTAAWSDQQRAMPPAPAGGDQTAGNRWSLGDLLARASTEVPQQPVSPGGAPVLNLEAIAGALDAETASAIWARTRAGQRGIMVRSLYSADGRATFDEVVRRYGSEQTFHGTVDKFLADFERLLHDTEARDASGQQTEAHLASMSGRTYLFLAHAAGRLN